MVSRYVAEAYAILSREGASSPFEDAEGSDVQEGGTGTPQTGSTHAGSRAAGSGGTGWLRTRSGGSGEGGIGEGGTGEGGTGGGGPGRSSTLSLGLAAAALSAARIARGIVDEKVVLAWLMTLVGAPLALVGMLVPLREGCVALGGRLWSGAGSGRSTWRAAGFTAFQGIAALGIAGVALTLWGTLAGAALLVLLALMALGQAAAGVGLERMLAAASARRRRAIEIGAWAVGTAGTAFFALALIAEIGPRGALVIWGIMLGGGLLLAAGLCLALGEEGAGAGGRRAQPAPVARDGLIARLRADQDLWHIAGARAALAAVTLAPPYLVALVSVVPGRGLEALGSLVLATALAGPASAQLWGRLPSRSNRWLLAAAAGLGAAALALAALADVLGVIGAPLAAPLLIFAVMASHHGIQIGAARQLARARGPEAQDASRAGAAGAVAGLLGLGVPLALAASVIGTGGVLAALAAVMALSVWLALRAPDARGLRAPAGSPRRD